jgi:hypothetical protein
MENLQSRKELVQKTFESMPENFTSHEFVQALVEKGADKKRMYAYSHIEFLKNKCHREGKKTWSKKPEEKLEIPAGQVVFRNEDGKIVPVSESITGSFGYVTPFPTPMNAIPFNGGAIFSVPDQVDKDKRLIVPHTVYPYQMKSETIEGLEEEAIKFLKDRGYKILKTTTVEV